MPDTEMGWEGTVTVGQAAQYVRDLTVDLTATEVDDTARDCQGWESARAGLRKLAVNFDMLVVQGDSVHSSLKTAFANGTKLASVNVKDKYNNAITADMYCTRFTRNEPLDGVVTVSVTLRNNRKPTIT